MSAENVEIARRAVDAFNRRDRSPTRSAGRPSLLSRRTVNAFPRSPGLGTRARRPCRRRLLVPVLRGLVAAGMASSLVACGGGGGGGYPAGWKPYRGPIPILEYHPIQPPVKGMDRHLFVPQADFQAQMKWLDDHDYEAVTLDQVEKAWYEHGELPPKPIIVSFDDGYLSQYVAGFLVLQALHWPGVMNLHLHSDLPNADVRKMVAAGWELASHTISHVDLTKVDAARLRREVAGSRRILRRRFGTPVDNFCYPFGSYDQAVITAVKRAGYRGAESEVRGLATRAHPYVLNRIEIEYGDHLNGFIEKLKAARPRSPSRASRSSV
jgi:peptidoglycan/xylan/chitin deacetylase (PgdA/CDA1 family)